MYDSYYFKYFPIKTEPLMLCHSDGQWQPLKSMLPHSSSKSKKNKENYTKTMRLKFIKFQNWKLLSKTNKQIPNSSRWLPCFSQELGLSEKNIIYAKEKNRSSDKLRMTLKPLSGRKGLLKSENIEKAILLQSKGRGWLTINYYRKDSPFLSLEVPSPMPTC